MAYRIDPASSPAGNFTRITRELADEVTASLDAASSDHARGLHQARKAIKRQRALLRLMRSAAPGALKRCDAGFRDAARAVAGAREATAMIETLERLIAARPDRIVDAGLGEIRAILIRRREQMGDDAEALADQIAAARAGVDAAKALALDVDLWRADVGTLHHGFRKTLSKWAGALDRARDKGEPEAFHDLRKAVKAHAAHLALLRDFWPDDVRERRRVVDELGEALGELNDVNVMMAAIRDGSLGLPREVGTDGFAKLLRKEAKRLSQKTLAGARKQLDTLPEGLGRRFRSVVGRSNVLEEA